MAPLKAWLKKEDIYDNDLYDVLSSYGIRDAPKDFQKITQPKWDTIWRKCTVEKFKELKDQTSRNRLQRKMKRLEAVWRKESGIKMTSIKGSNKKSASHKKTKASSHQPRTKKKNKIKAKSYHKSASKNTKSRKKKPASNTGKNKKKRGGPADFSLKQFLQKNGCYELELCKALKRRGIHSENDIGNLSESQFDTIVRKVRVDRFAQLKDTASRNRCGKVLVTFEKIWRKKSGNKKTNL
eukprot:UN08071